MRSTTSSPMCGRDFCGHPIDGHDRPRISSTDKYPAPATRCKYCPCVEPIDDSGTPVPVTRQDARAAEPTLFRTATPDVVDPARSPAFVSDSRTSFEASRAFAPRMNDVDRRMLEYITNSGPSGHTCDEAESDLGMLHQTASSAIVRLKKRGLIADTNQVRRTRAQRPAAVYVRRRGGMLR